MTDRKVTVRRRTTAFTTDCSCCTPTVSKQCTIGRVSLTVMGEWAGDELGSKVNYRALPVADDDSKSRIMNCTSSSPACSSVR